MLMIDKNVPIPPERRKPNKYPFADMKVGDSFFAPGMRPEQIAGSIVKYRGQGWEFTRRALTENGEAGTRVWRTK